MSNQIQENVTEVEQEYYDERTGEKLDRLGRRLNPEGQELPDPRPMRPPLGFQPQVPLHELIRQMIRSEQLAKEAEEMDAGSFDEEDDFDVDDDDYDPTSPWEENFDIHPITGDLNDRGEGQRPSEEQDDSPVPAAPLTPE